MTSVARICTITGCDWGVKAKGLCDTHYARKLAGREIAAPIRGRGRKCEVPECLKINRSRGLCVTHRATAERYKLTTAEVIKRDLGVCDLCGGPPAKGRSLHVDHDHACCPGGRTCGQCNRGFLCQTCNMGLGSFKDSIELLTRAVHYLQEGVVADLTSRSSSWEVL